MDQGNMPATGRPVFPGGVFDNAVGYREEQGPRRPSLAIPAVEIPQDVGRRGGPSGGRPAQEGRSSWSENAINEAMIPCPMTSRL